MAMQSQQVDLAALFGGRLSAANEQHKDKPVDKGFQQLPGGIKNGIAHLQVMVVEPYKDDKMGAGTKGKPGFRASAVVVYSGHSDNPDYHDGIKVKNMQTTMFASLCDIPAKDRFPAVSLEDNMAVFVNIFKMFGVVCPHTKATDPDGRKTNAFYYAAMKALTDPKKPRYVSFSTSEYKAAKKVGETDEQFNTRKAKIYQNWHGEVAWQGIQDPAQSVNVVSSNGTAHQPHPTDNPPTVGADNLPILPPGESLEDEIARLVDEAQRGVESAQAMLEDRARAHGWTDEEVADSEVTWEQIGTMAQTPPPNEEDQANEAPTIGSKWNFVKRDTNGNKLTDKEGTELPSQEVEVVTVDNENQTCTLKAVKGGRTITDMKSRKPLVVKWEWLE